VVGAEVDDPDRGRQRGGEGRGLAVREREEHQVRVGQGRGVGRAEREVQAAEVRVYGGDGLTGPAVRGRRDQVELGVPRDQAEQLAAGVAARPGHRDPDTHQTLRISMQRPGYQGARTGCKFIHPNA
jgi:hypothetical protein